MFRAWRLEFRIPSVFSKTWAWHVFQPFKCSNPDIPSYDWQINSGSQKYYTSHHPTFSTRHLSHITTNTRITRKPARGFSASHGHLQSVCFGGQAGRRGGLIQSDVGTINHAQVLGSHRRARAVPRARAARSPVRRDTRARLEAKECKEQTGK